MADKRIIDLPSLVTQASTDIYEVSADGSGSFKETRAQMLSYFNKNLPGISQQLWVNEISGDDANSGTNINSALASYPVALAQARTGTPSATNQYLIKAIGDQTIIGDVEFDPFVHVDFENSGTFNCTGNFVLSSNWSAGSNPYCNLKNTNPNPGTQIDFVFPADNQPLFQFSNVNLDSTVSLTGLDVSQMPNVAFDNCNIAGIDPGAITSDLCNVNITGGNINQVVFTNSSTSNSCVFSSNGASFSSLSFDCSAGGEVGISLISTSYETSGLSINGNNFNISIDATSYNSIPILTGGASLDNFQLISLSDGINQTSFLPTSYTKTNNDGADPWSIESLTADFAGINNALAAFSSVSNFSSRLTSTQSNVTGDATQYPIVFDSQFTPLPSPNYDETTGIFTASQEGPHVFSASAYLQGITADSIQGTFTLVTTGSNPGTYSFVDDSPIHVADQSIAVVVAGATVIYMQVGDTAQIFVQVSGSDTPNISIYGETGTNFETTFSGSFIGSSASSSGSPPTQPFSFSYDSGNSLNVNGTPTPVFGTYTANGDYVTANLTIKFQPSATTGYVSFHAPIISGTFPSSNLVSVTGTVYKDLLTAIGDGQIGYAGNYPAAFVSTDTIGIPFLVTTPVVNYYMNMSFSYQYQNF